MKAQYKIKCENEEGRTWIVWIEAADPDEALDNAVTDPKVSGAEVVGIRYPR